MAIEVKMIQHNDCLEFVATGEFDLEGAVENFRQALDQCLVYEIYKVMINFYDLGGNILGQEKTFYAYSVDNHYKTYLRRGGTEIKFAYVGPGLISPN